MVNSSPVNFFDRWTLGFSTLIMFPSCIDGKSLLESKYVSLLNEYSGRESQSNYCGDSQKVDKWRDRNKDLYSLFLVLYINPFVNLTVGCLFWLCFKYIHLSYNSSLNSWRWLLCGLVQRDLYMSSMFTQKFSFFSVKDSTLLKYNFIVFDIFDNYPICNKKT